MSSYISSFIKKHGLRQYDARSPMHIRVLPQDIAQAKMKKASLCALARACKRIDTHIESAHFYKTVAWIEYADKKIVRYLLPVSVQKEIVSFDRSGSMAPGLYQLSPPYRSAKMGAIKRRSLKRPGRHQPSNTNITRRVRHVTTMVRKAFET